jgi:aminoglycoside 6'-N-acetyltransferase I|tara:strand:- start:786 stop:1061 length:276 start_codon:yes stop_codon:yes gene_type:complete
MGFGRKLVEDLSSLAKSSGAVSIWAGTSDETDATSFSRYDLYKNMVEAVQNISAPPHHPIYFWLKMGFSIVGVIPDEEGLGKPSIHFAKRL